MTLMALIEVIKLTEIYFPALVPSLVIPPFSPHPSHMKPFFAKKGLIP